MPQTRHYEMKDSGVEWIGKMPKDWDIVRFKRMHRGSNVGLSLDKDYWSTNEEDTIFYTAGFKSIHTSCKDIVPEMLTKENDLLLARNGTPYVYFPCVGAIYTDHIIRVGIENGYNKAFVRYCLQQSIANEVVDTVSIATWSVPIWNRQCLPHPPLPEQTAIATYLDEKCATIDAIIAEAKASIEEYKSWKASVIFETVTKGLNPNAEMKDSGVEWIGLIPGHWVVKRLKYVAVSLSKGNGITKDETAEDGDTPCVRYGEIYAKYNQSFMECQTRTYKDIITSPKYFTYGDILITCTGELVEEIGKSVAYLGSEKCLAGGDIIVLKHTQNASFLNYALNCNYAQSQKSCDKAKLKVVHISAYDVGNIWMALPPLPEQTAIASYLDSKCAAIDSVIAEKEALISDLETYKRSLIFEVVTGKRRVC